MKILVTGGAGFIGSHFVHMLIGAHSPPCASARVTVLDKLTYAGRESNLEAVAKQVDFVRGDVCDADLLARILPEHDVVVNFAAESHVDRSITDGAEFARTNVLGVQTLMQACLESGVRKVVQISTDEVYGSITRGSWSEDAPLDPRSPYSAAKAGGDLIALAYARTHGLPVCITRCGNNYGPRQYPEKIIPLFITNLLQGRRIPLYGDGGNIRDWVHVDDHCQGIRLVMERGSPGEVYHIGGTAELTNLEITQRLLNAFGAGWEHVAWVPDRKGHDRRYHLSDDKLRALGYAPTVGFDRGLAEVISWYRANPAWWNPLQTSMGAS